MENKMIMQIEKFSFSYPEQSQKAVDDISLSVHQGDFLLLIGESGSGKTTLLRALKPMLTPHGKKAGQITYAGQKVEELSEEQQVSEIGFVLQNPESQIVTNKVNRELYFGLENLGESPKVIKRKVAEMVTYFGMDTWFSKETFHLSGGQKQILNLAAVMLMNPKVLILDEPTAQLDPVSARNFFHILRQINEDMGTTIIITEQRLHEVMPLCNRMALMEDGRIIYEGEPLLVVDEMKRCNHRMLASMPSMVRAYVEVGGICPFTVKEGKQWFSEHCKASVINHNQNQTDDVVVTGKELYFQYERKGKEILKDLSIKIKANQMNCIVGGNGSGKSTLLNLLAGVEKPSYGKIQMTGKCCLLPQNPRYLFLTNSVREELALADEKIISTYGLESLLDRHPFDLSGGEMARLALAKMAIESPDIYLLDEPTKGVDGVFKNVFKQIFRELIAMKKTIVMVSHDLEFCAEIADYMMMLFDGNIVFDGTREQFFGENLFYTTTAARVAAGIAKGVITSEDVINLCQNKLSNM